MSAQPARAYLAISEVLAQLRTDFPDVSVSKIRFLETEGLLTPARSPSGYRRFTATDVERLRFILTAQRDQYLPLRVIKERLTEPPAAAADGAERPLSRRELVEAAGISDALVTELETFGLISRVGRQYGPDALVVAKTAAALSAYGVEARHLTAVRSAAEREATMIESLVAPIQRQRGAGARELAARTATELAGLVLRLHGALVAGALGEAGLAADSGTQEPARDGQRERGVEGASA
jgi:DNA-binding transcriptional MerR regulator